MIRFSWLAAAPLLSGCFMFSTGADSQVEDVPESMRRTRLVVPATMDVHLLGDPSLLKVGQWARYRESDRTMTVAVVGKEGDNLWIEVVDEGEPRQVSARLVTPDGDVERALYCEIGKDGRSPVEPQPLEQYLPPARARRTESERTTGRRDVTLEGGRKLSCHHLKVRLEDLEGRFSEVESLWHPDVPPLFDVAEEGGLVYRKTREGEVRLLEFGTDAKPLCPRDRVRLADPQDPPK